MMQLFNDLGRGGNEKSMKARQKLRARGIFFAFRGAGDDYGVMMRVCSGEISS